MPAADLLPEDEAAKVKGWRTGVLLDAGYPLKLAEKIAASDADLHEATRLVDGGCEPEVAAEIVL